MKNHPKKNLTGKRFGKLTVLGLARFDIRRKSIWRCQCDCGILKDIRGNSLISQGTQSCGCLQREKTSLRMKSVAKNFTGNKNPAWKGGRRHHSAGYIIVYSPGHSNAWKQGYVFEHVLIMSNFLGRPLLPDETVHHKNGIKDDNRLKNLELRIKNHGPGQGLNDLIPYWIEKLKLYKPEALYNG